MNLIRCPRCHATMAERTPDGIEIRHRRRRYILRIDGLTRVYCPDCQVWFDLPTVEQEQGGKQLVTAN